ncbi:MAG TPA: molybdopterin molybdenumtransferase MoeA, partial [Anaeromyxobacteraceae bacterium]|nr:molybdopterin molybdenumtransferase MoeA [Anaeromyxobacteraceae bacterium]
MKRLLAIRDEVEAAVAPVAAEECTLGEAGGRWLAADARAAIAAPPYRCSAMDGYAIRAADVAGPVVLPVRGAIYAGDAAPPPLAPGEAARIFTGGTVPPGADAVVREEAVKREGERARFLAPARPGENVRLAGEDVPAGGLALEAGTRLGPRQRALLAAV